MPVERVRFRRRKLSLTSLIDVIFLLLLFFMLSSTFSRNVEVPFLAAAAGGQGATDQPPVFLRLDGRTLSLNGVVIPQDELMRAVTERTAGNPAPHIIVAVTGNATSQGLVDVLVPVGRIPGADITVVE